MTQPQNQYSHLTAKDRNYLSFPTQFLLDRDLLSGKILDFGCGFGNDVKLLQQKGLDIHGYDPHYFPQYPQQKFDIIFCFYVLNVLLPYEQALVLMSVSHLLKPGGKAYYSVRRDLKKEGFRQHYIHQKPTYQCQVKLPFLSIYQDEMREIYEYRHYNRQKHSSQKCPFCNPHSYLKFITESTNAYAIFDGYPVSRGHSLIIPKHHISSYFELPWEEQTACWLMVNQVQKILVQQFQPDGFNVGFNVNPAGGQKINHTAIHIIPRYRGDPHQKTGGIRQVILKVDS